MRCPFEVVNVRDYLFPETLCQLAFEGMVWKEMNPEKECSERPIYIQPIIYI